MIICVFTVHEHENSLLNIQISNLEKSLRLKRRDDMAYGFNYILNEVLWSPKGTATFFIAFEI